MVAGAGALLLAVFAGYLLLLDHRIEATWQSHRDATPSRIYAAPTPLYPGMSVASVDLLGTLRRLGYREVARDPGPGQYRRDGESLEVRLHDFLYPDGPFESFPLEVRIRDGRIVSLRDERTDEPVYNVRLEPEEITAVFDARMEDRTPVALDRLPPRLVDAVLSVEDRRFFDHEGVDWRRVVGAGLHDLLHLDLSQGGSTITQQLVKNYYLSGVKSLRRKLKEALMALLLEAHHTKREILDAYLNEVYLGQTGPVSIVGVGEAARHYFSRDAFRLDLAECALLAGMIQNPGRYDPFEHPEAAKRRRATVLRLMEEQGRIGPDERKRADAEPLPAPPPGRPLRGAPYFVDYVLREIGDRYSRDLLQHEGYRVFTTLDPRAQRAAEQAVEGGLAELDGRGAGERGRAAASDSSGGPQAAFVVLDPQTGDILALVGGRSYAASQFDRAAEARRQPGSVFKPFVYLAALSDPDSTWTLASRVSDSSFTVRSQGKSWTPENYDGTEHGRVTLRTALEHSYNIATARLGMAVGLGRVIRIARAIGITDRLEPVPSLSLGAFEVTPLEMAAAYTTFADGGIRARPISVTDVLAPDGTPVESHPIEFSRVADPGPVYLVNRALEGVLTEGTASSAARLGYTGPAAGKTGTSSGYRDAWFVGYTPGMVALAWVGYDDNRSLGASGAGAALPVWVRFARAYPGDELQQDFSPPGGVVQMRIDEETGKKAGSGPGCGASRVEVFLEGTQPTRSCRKGGWWIF